MKRTVIGYGLGEFYVKVKEMNLLDGKIQLDYVCDQKWENTDKTEFDNIPVISKTRIPDLENPLVIIFIKDYFNVQSIIEELTKTGIECKWICEMIPIEYTITGKTLKEKYSNGIYRDSVGNEIKFDRTVPDKLTVSFGGTKNRLIIGENLLTASTYIRFGSDGECILGENSKFIGVIFCISYGRVEVGSNCLFSSEVILRNSDGHHIFDKETGRRINRNSDLAIGNHVWLCQRAMILRGGNIGSNSVVGAGSVVTKMFGENVIVAGVPARVVRENIVWSNDGTEFFDRDYFDECIEKVAME